MYPDLGMTIVLLLTKAQHKLVTAKHKTGIYDQI